MTRALMQVKNAWVKRGRRLILKEVSFSFHPGESIAIIGANGSGKTTLLRALLGLVPLEVGKIYLKEKPIALYSRKALARRMAYVPQDPGLGSAGCTVREYVLMGRYPYRPPWRFADRNDFEIADNAITSMGITGFAERRLSSLSGGERQKVVIAGALAQQPDILLLDEPTAFMDPGSRQQIHALLRSIHRETNTTLLTVTHDLNAAIGNSDRILALHHGRLVFAGSPAELLEADLLNELYGVPFRTLETTTLSRSPQFVVIDT